jgi:hypothetical protein
MMPAPPPAVMLTPVSSGEITTAASASSVFVPFVPENCVDPKPSAMTLMMGVIS